MRIKAESVFVLIVTGVILSSPACSSRRSYVKPPPDWVNRTPRMKDQICAVGASGPTLYREDGKKYAVEAARGELAHTLGTRVYSIMLDTESVMGSGTEQATTAQATSFASDVVVVGSQPMEYWVDDIGDASGGQKNTTYALVCLPLDASRVTGFMAKLLKGVATTGSNITDTQAVRERAKSAFDELEKEEAKAEAKKAGEPETAPKDERKAAPETEPPSGAEPPSGEAGTRLER